jgi:hypothetical protein
LPGLATPLVKAHQLQKRGILVIQGSLKKTSQERRMRSQVSSQGRSEDRDQEVLAQASMRPSRTLTSCVVRSLSRDIN